MMRPFHFDPFDPMHIYDDLLPENPTREELEEYQRLMEKYICRTVAIFFVLLAACAVVTLFSGCATQKQEHQEQTHVVHADSSGTEQSQAVQVVQQMVDIDSIVTVVMKRTREEFARQEQQHETTTETLTETVDSLGRVVRQSQKVTDRTLSRQEQQRIDRLEQTFEQQIRQAVTQYDSLWQDRFARYQSVMTDSMQSVRDLQKQTSASTPLTWWQQLRLHLANIMLFTLLIIAAVWFIRKKLKISSTDI